MSDDIAERLRKRAYRLAAKDFNGDGAKLAMEAADEITRLRADLAAITAERGALLASNKRLRKAVKDAYFEGWNTYLESLSEPEDDWKNSDARAALEGVTETKK